MNFKTASLSTRLLIASAIVLPLFLGLSAYLLDLAFQKSLITAERERLQGHIYLLLAAAELSKDKLTVPAQLTEPRFSQLNSGLYANIHNASGEVVWRSASAALLSFNSVLPDEVNPGASVFGTTILNEKEYYTLSFDVAYETSSGASVPYRFNVLHTQQSLRSELSAYREQLWWLLGGLAILLIATQGLVMRWGLKPLQNIAKDLVQVEQGHSDRLSGRYPREIKPVTDNLNRVLETEKLQQQRYRNTLADLAHSLKTPLAVLRSALGKPGEQSTQLFDEQLLRMDQIISHQLQRAVISNETSPGKKVDVLNIIERITNALQKVYKDKDIRLNIVAQKNPVFFGAESDLMEVLGNVIDNAFKYANKKIDIEIKSDESGVLFVVSDDGAGIDKALQKKILERGARADTATPGQGIGLAVATDIISSYRGSLEIKQSTLGGAEFHIFIPGTR